MRAVFVTARQCTGAPELNRFDLKMFDQEGLHLRGADGCSRWFRTSYWSGQNDPRDQCDENDGRDYSEYEGPGIAPLPGEHHMRVIISRILFICRNFRISCHFTSRIAYRKKYIASNANPSTTTMMAIIGHGNCFLVAVALSPGFSSSGSLGGRFGCAAAMLNPFLLQTYLG